MILVESISRRIYNSDIAPHANNKVIEVYVDCLDMLPCEARASRLLTSAPSRRFNIKQEGQDSLFGSETAQWIQK